MSLRRALAQALALTLSVLVAGCAPLPMAGMPERRAASLPASLPPMARFAPAPALPPGRSNAAIAQDFLDLSFQMESGRPIARLSRFEGPVSVALASGAPATLGPDLDQLIARLRAEAGIALTRLPDGQPAAIIIETLPRARLQRAVPQAACFVVPRLSSWAQFRALRDARLLDWTTLEQRERAAIFIPADVAPQELRDCLHEELAQALGPLNDLYRLSDSIFNDDNFHAVLTGFDMLILRAYNDPALRSGMTRAQVAQRLPGILARLNPAGERGRAPVPGPTPRAWIAAVETALGPGSRPARRLAAARDALAIAQNQGWQDARLAFSHFALARLSLPRDPETSLSSFLTARSLYQRIAPGGVQVAHIDMQLAAFALNAGQVDRALTLTEGAIPVATRAENASLLASLLMIRAAALDAAGQPERARTLRLDSLAWGRYGFGPGEVLRTRLSEVTALAPAG